MSFVNYSIDPVYLFSFGLSIKTLCYRICSSSFAANIIMAYEKASDLNNRSFDQIAGILSCRMSPKIYAIPNSKY